MYMLTFDLWRALADFLPQTADGRRFYRASKHLHDLYWNHVASSCYFNGRSITTMSDYTTQCPATKIHDIILAHFHAPNPSLAPLQSFSHLKSIVLKDCHISPEQFKQILAITQLQSLTINSEFNISDELLLLARLPNLTSFCMGHGCTAEEKYFNELPSQTAFPCLQELSIGGVHNPQGSNTPTAILFLFLSSCTRLTKLSLQHGETKEADPWVLPLTNLQYLKIGGTRPTAMVSHLINLQTLKINPNWSLALLSKLTKLKILQTSMSGLDADSLTFIRRSTQLEKLQILLKRGDLFPSMVLTWANLRSLSLELLRPRREESKYQEDFDRPKVLSLSNVPLGAAQYLSESTQLTSLTLSNCLNANFDCTVIRNLYQLTTLDLSYNSLRTWSVEALTCLTSLKSLHILSNEIEDNGFGALCSHLTQLTELNCSQNPISIQGLCAISALHKLKLFQAGDHQVFVDLSASGALLQSFRTMTSLKTLNLSICDFLETDFVKLQAHPSLTQLEVGPGWTGSSLIHFSSIPKLKRLIFRSWATVDPSHLHCFSLFSSLETIVIQKGTLDRSAIKAFEKVTSLTSLQLPREFVNFDEVARLVKLGVVVR